MPPRGYRKGQSDTQVPLTRQLYARLSPAEFDDLSTEAADRAMTLSKLVRTLVMAHLTRQSPRLPSRNLQAATIRELGRIGNNLNQLAHVANRSGQSALADDLRQSLAMLNAKVADL